MSSRRRRLCAACFWLGLKAAGPFGLVRQTDGREAPQLWLYGQQVLALDASEQVCHGGIMMAVLGLS